MKRWLLWSATVLAALALAACAAEKALPQEGPAPAAPAPEAKPAWQGEWERVLAAAKQEGRLALMGPAGDEQRRALTDPFEKRYGIKVEYLGGRGPEFMTRIKPEREAGQYLWDVQVGGLTHWIPYLDSGYLDPMEPAFILPDIKDPKNWWQGKLHWIDPQRRILIMALSTANVITINPNLVKPEEIKSYRDLLDPKWKGRLLSDDPRIAGSAQSQFHFFYIHKELGPDFIRALLKQDLTISRDRRQQLEWLAQGRHPILIGASRTIALPLKKQGLPIKDLDPRGVKEGSSTVEGVSNLYLINRAPHPNAAKVFINWLLTKEGQTYLGPIAGAASLRLDVSADHLEPWEIPQEGYLPLYGLEAHATRDKVRQFVEEILGR